VESAEELGHDELGQRGGKATAREEKESGGLWRGRSGPQARQADWAESRGRRKKEGKFVFSFSNFSKANLKMQIQNNLKFDFKSHHSKIIMQQHECTHMVVNLYLILI